MTWIIPKNLHTSVFVQDMEALTLDLKECSQILEQSVLVRSRPMQWPTWLRKWKRDSWTLHLSGRILKPSHGNHFMEKWTSSVAAFLVNPSQLPVKEKEMKIQDIYFHISKEELGLSDLPLFSLKTFKASSQVNLDQVERMKKERPFCFMSSESWKDWITKQRQEYSVRVNAVHHINAKEFLYLVFPMTQEMHLENYPPELIQMHGHLSEDKLKPWGTPRTGIAKAPSGQIKKDGIDLKAWSGKLENQVCQMHGHLSEDKDKSHGNHQGKLNPRWVETLMGIPIGWTMVNCVNPYAIELMNSECLAMELCQQRQKEHSEHCGQNWATPNARDHKGPQTDGFLERGYGYQLPDHVKEASHNNTQRTHCTTKFKRTS